MGSPVSIVIPNYNGRALMETHLPSVLQALDAYSPGGELIVVDDGSSDGSAAWLEQMFPAAKQIRHETNKGFQAACVSGIDAAEHEYIVLLNTDVAPFKQFIAPLTATLDDETVFAAGALAMDSEGKLVGENLKVPVLTKGKLKFKKLKGLDLASCQAALPVVAPTLFTTGGFMAMKKSLYLDLGGFDPLFAPFYYEDADLCWRAWKRGFRVLLVRSSVAIHAHEGTILAHHKKREVRRIQERNRMILLWKNLTDPDLFWRGHVWPMAVRIAFQWLVLDMDFYEIFPTALKMRKAVLAARSRMRQEARRSDQEIFEEIRQAAPEQVWH